MKPWILYYDRNYNALAWPFLQAWDAVVQSETPLIAACEDFGVVAPTDGPSEVPSVPANLPRMVPRGRYRMAVYHDEQYLYVILDCIESTPVVTPSMWVEQVQVPQSQTSSAMLTLLSSRNWHFYHFCHSAESSSATISSALGGARRSEISPPELDWECLEHKTEAGTRLGWRIARSSLLDVLDGDDLQLSISRAGYQSHEYVAWGAGAIWGARPDEMGTVRLVKSREKSAWPICNRVQLEYDPQRETGRFHLRWQDVYETHEQPTDNDEPGREIKFDKCAFRLNGQLQILPLSATNATTELAIPDGHNFVEVSTVGEAGLRFYFEKCSGQRITPCAFPPREAFGEDRFKTQLELEIATLHRQHTKRRQQQQPLNMSQWPLYRAASAGRVHAWINPDERLLQILREVADESLELQRADGTFRGNHRYDRYGSTEEPPRWAGGAYDTGQAGELWAVAAWQLGDDKYREASQKLVEAYRQYRIEFNYNYGAFTLFHLAAHYRLTRDPLALEHGMYYAQDIAATNILPMGFQAGHNFYTVYGFITLRGLANFCQVLPEDEPYRKTLRELCVRMTNQLLTRMQPNGTFDARDRYYLGEYLWVSALFSVALLLEGEEREKLETILNFILHAPSATRGYALLESEVARYFYCREKFRLNEPINILELI